MRELADLAQVGTFFVAVFALAVAYVQITAARESQREATAKDVFRDYLRLSFENPEYGAPSKNLNQDEKYRWFVAVALNACDEIASSVLPDESWQKVIRGVLVLHRKYLVSAEFQEDGGWSEYSKELKNLF
jgi:hypothetical protein